MADLEMYEEDSMDEGTFDGDADVYGDLSSFNDDGSIRNTNVQTADVPDEGMTNEPEVESESPAEDDPWAWAKDKNPEHVKNSWEKFTQNQQELAAKERALQPYQQLYEELVANPNLQAYIQQYFENGGQVAVQAPEGMNPKIVEIENELRILQTERQVEKEWSELQGMINKNGYPEVKKDDVIQYMIDNQIPNMKAAYRDMTYDTIRTKAEQSTLENIKKNKTANLPSSSRSDSNAKQSRRGMKDAMDDDSFFGDYQSLIRELAGG